MWFRKVLRKLFKRNSVCDKCNSPSYGNLFCDKCKEYIDYVETRKLNDIKVKEELKRRNWIKVRDEFLNNEDG